MSRILPAVGLGLALPAADVQINQLQDSPDPAVRGGVITYTLNVENSDIDTAHNVVLAMPLPATTLFVSATGSGIYNAGSGTVSWNLGDLLGTMAAPAGTTHTVSVSLRTTETTGSTLVATANIATTDTDRLPANNTLSQTTTINNGADLRLTTAGSPDPVISGGTVTFTVDVANLGPNAAAGSITVTDTLPSNTTWVSSSGSGWSFSRSGQTITCTLPAALASGASAATISIVAQVTASSGTITNLATVSSGTGDPDPNNNTATASVQVSPGTDLSVTKTVSGTALSLQNTTFVLHPRNTGSSSASTVTVTDTLPGGFTFVSASGTGWTCSASGQVVTCTRSAYAAGATDDITLIAAAPEALTPTSYTNTATIASITADPASSNNTASATFNLMPDGVDLSLSKSKTPNPVAQGAPMSSTLTVHNGGPRQAAANTLTVTETLDDALEVYNDAFSGTGWSYGGSHTTGTAPDTTTTLTFTYGLALNSGSSANPLRIATTARGTGQVVNHAAVAYSGTPGDWDLSNNTASASATATSTPASPDLAIAQSVTTGSGDTTLQATESALTYTLTVTNNGPSGANATGIVVTDVLPAILSGAISVSRSGGTSSAAFSCTHSGATVTCTQTAGVLATGETVIFTVTADRPLLDGAFTNTASVRSTTLGDPDPSNNTASATLTIDPIADIQVAAAVSPDPVKAGTESTFVLSVKNNGPSSAANVVLTDGFGMSAGDTGFTLISVTPSKGTWSGMTAGQKYTGSPSFTASIGTMASGEVQTVTVVIRPNWQSGTAVRTVSDTAQVATSTAENTTGGDNGNNAASAVLTVNPAAVDLLVNLTDGGVNLGPDPLGYDPATPANNVLTYRITVTNNGPSLASGITFTAGMAAPAGRTIRFLGAGATPGDAALNALAICDNVGSTVTGGSLLIHGNLDLEPTPVELASGGSIARYLAFRVESAPTPRDIYALTTTLATNETDSDTNNNLATETTTVRTRADLAVTKTPSINPVQIRQPFYWTITVVNNGPGDAENTVVSDTLPSGMAFYTPGGSAPAPYNAPPYSGGVTWTINDASASHGTGTIGGQTLACSVGTLEAGKTLTILVPVSITSYAATYGNTAVVATDSVDPTSSNNTTTGTVSVQRSRLSGTMFKDYNNNGIMDPGDTVIASPVVNLRLTGTDGYGNAVSVTAATNSNGSGGFLFDNLSPSDASGYTLTQLSQPSGYWDGQDTPGTSGGTAAALGSTVISGIHLDANMAATGYLIGELPQNLISGYLFSDLNNNGSKDTGESGISGQTVHITGTSFGPDGLEGTADDSALSGMTITNASGLYTFTPLYAGRYTVVESQPAGYLDGKESATWPGAVIGSDTISSIELTSFGLSATNNNFGELPPATVRGTVFIDANDNATKDSGENAYVNGVKITLTGTDDLGQAVSLAQTTSSGGTYAFTGLRPSDASGYAVAEEDVDALTHTGAQTGTSGGVIGGITRSANTGVPGAAFFAISNIAVKAGDNAAGYNFGEKGQGLSGRVYVDLDNDGIQDPGEPGLAGVRIVLSGTTFAGQAIATAIGASASTATTDSNGDYTFPSLPASDAAGYTLTEDPTSAPLAHYTDGQDSVGTLGGSKAVNDQISAIVLGTAGMGTGYDFAEIGGSIRGLVYLDRNRNGAYDAGDTPLQGVTMALSGAATASTATLADGTFVLAGLPSGTYALTETQPADYASATTARPPEASGVTGTTITGMVLAPGASITGALFGEKTERIGGYVYLDADNDGVKAAAETGLAGVSMRLTGQSAGGSVIDLTTTTAADGSYGFGDLPVADASGYRIIETQPSAYLDGRHSAGPGGGNATVANVIQAIPFSAATSYTGYNFGEVQASSLSGRVYFDKDSDGAYDDGEGIAGVVVQLLGADDQGTLLNLSATTASDGTYSFSNVRPSGAPGYTIAETQPDGIGDYPGTSGTLVGTVGGAPAGTAQLNQVTGVVLASGQSGSGYDFRDHASALSGHAFLDANDNGVKDAGEAGIENVLITLRGTDAEGSVERTVRTGADGSYSFAGLRAGAYTLIETQPVVYQDGRERAGSAGGTTDNSSFTSSDAQNWITAISLPAATEAIGYLFGERTGLTGAFSGKAWYNSIARDQVQQAGEPALAGWLVEARRGSVVLASTTTADDGTWTLSGLPAGGGYELCFLNPVSHALYGTPVSQDPGYGDSTPDYTRHTIGNMTLRSGGNVILQNLPVDPSGVVYDSITRTAVSGATVTLQGPAGFDAATHLVGGTANLSQTTDASGFYQFLLTSSAPTGTYTIKARGPAAYLQEASSLLPPARGPLNPGSAPTTFAVQAQATPPTGSQATTYYLSMTLGGSSANVVNNHLPLDPLSALHGGILLTKSSPKLNVVRGELVPYTITARNTMSGPLASIELVDQLPPGFKYRTGSARLDGVPVEPTRNGRLLSWRSLSFAPGTTRTLTLVMVVGSGVGDGEYTNSAWAMSEIANSVVSNVGTATVRITPDPDFDCTDVIGKVFDDRNANGVQDEGEPGLPNIGLATVNGRILATDAQGRFHIACADVPQVEHGSNFILKLDDRTLPTGYRLTTDNPGVVRATRGKMIKLNFGATHYQVVRLEISAGAFEDGTARLKPAWQERFDGLPGLLAEKPSVLRLVYRHLPQDKVLGRKRLDALAAELRKRWKAMGDRYPLSLETEPVEVAR